MKNNNNTNTNTNTNIGTYAEMPFFVGYHAAENGIGKVRLGKGNDYSIAIKTCGDDGIWDDDWWFISKKDFLANWEYCKRVAQKLGIFG